VVCVLFVVVAFFTRMYLQSEAASSWARLNAPHAFLPARMDTLALGALLAIAARETDMLRRMSAYALPVIAGCLALLAVYFVDHKGLLVLNRDMQLYGLTALALLFAALLSLVVTAREGSVLTRVFSHPALMFFGQYAYGLYVVHLLVGFTLADVIARRTDVPTVYGSFIPGSIGFMLLAGAASVAVAWVSWHAFEKQFLKLKRFFPYDEAAAQRDAMPQPRTSEAMADPMAPRTS
jgi:peptidoglycan/LPS O-acetylase OafA/YrhL